MNFNRVILGGYLTRDPELRVTPKGTAICSFGLATNRTWRDDSGQQQTKACFVDVTAWGKTGETINKYLGKGAPILVEGYLDFDQWEDKQTGQKRSKLKVVAESFQFVGQAREGGAPDGDGSGEDTTAQRPAPAPAPRRPAPAPRPQHDINDEDVPF